MLHFKQGDEPKGKPETELSTADVGQVDRQFFSNNSLHQGSRQWTCSDHLRRRCLTKNVDAVLKWWTTEGLSAVENDSGLPAWISGIQIFIDFYLSSKSNGVVIHKGRWFDDIGNIPNLREVSLSQRSRSFQYLWGKLLKENGFFVQKTLQRPRSAALAMWSQCYRLNWSPSRLQLVDSFLFALHGRQLLNSADLLIAVPEGTATVAS